MATIRKRNERWQVQIRRKDAPFISKSFVRKAEALAWAREMDIEADRGLLQNDPKALQRITLGELLKRYKDEISTDKGACETEVIFISNFQNLALASKSLAIVKPSDFAKYRDQRLKSVSGGLSPV